MNSDIRDRILITTTTVTSLAALTIAVTPLFAQTRGTTPNQNSSQPQQHQQHQQNTHDMAQMMEKCKSKMAQAKTGGKANSNQGQHDKHLPNNLNPKAKTTGSTPAPSQNKK